MEQMKSYSIQLSQELAETTSARDTLLLQLTQERPSESHPLIQQYAQQIQTLRLEVAETRSKLNSFCTEEEEDRYLRSRHSMMTSISSSRKKRPVIQRMRTSSSSLLKKKKSQHVDHLIDLLRKEYMEESTDETVLHLSHAPVMEEKTELEDKTEMEDTFSNHQFLSMASPSAGPLAEPNSFEDDELEALAVPSWSDAPKAQSVSGGSTKRKSISLDSMWDDTDSSITTSRVDSVVLGNSSESHSNRPKPSTSNTKLKRQGKNLLKMLHQIQADLLVKRELVGQLERSEDQFAQMRVNYEERLNELKEHLVEIQKQRDTALKKGHSNTTTTVTSTLNTTTARPQSVMGGLRENREAQEVRFQFEVKVKRLMVENQELKKKNQEATKAVQTARSKAESAMQRLKSEIESLKLDKKQLNRTLKTEMDKARDAAITYEREVQQLKRRLVVALDSKKKLEETTEAQNQVLKKRTEETAAASLQMRQLTNVLRKAANEGTFLNEAALDRIMELAQISKSNIRTTKQTRGRASSFASEPSI
ncbi:uncharacterized protein B0P05DRAFT_582329 [Gilbertella persicaria]|nr:uncharacterized protein B0P05DRAFT_582329 [Gilbertella persicaria]KAI8047537.1 hypothetical protein B0P05DRAFT_582329 [Gilbertella persicaria]